ncbi:FMN-binding protein [Fusobacterium sp. PH5-44]|uniref:FMN-binding protein n=1 Tax=unclassified Fusobacterium TaxID=2648384 RepID=UPI003D25D3CC
MFKKLFYLSLFSLLFLINNSETTASTKLFHGIGQSSNLRVGPGKDKKGLEVYSLNYVTASAIFDENGKVINLIVDVLELSTPNYDGSSMPHFSGWPGTSGYNITDHESKEVIGVSSNTVDYISEEVANWKSKRDRGNAYGMNPKNEWNKQMDFYQNFFKGKSITEIEEWYNKNVSDKSGRPLSEDVSSESDKEKYGKLSVAEKKALVDVIAGATMSLKDNHGDIIGAIKKAYENKVEFTLNN